MCSSDLKRWVSNPNDKSTTNVKAARYHALVAGASGVVGRRLAEVLAADPDWEVTGLSRRAPVGACAFKTIAVDLTDAADCKQKLGALANTTHIFYAARYDHNSSGPEPIDLNTNMLRHLVDAVTNPAVHLGELGNGYLLFAHVMLRRCCGLRQTLYTQFFWSATSSSYNLTSIE